MAFIKLPRVANRRQTLAQDYNWPKRSAPVYMATRAGAIAMPAPITPRYASTAASMWQPAIVNATMLPGFYQNDRMGNQTVSPVIRNFGSVPVADYRPRNLGGLGAYYDLGAVDPGITITGTVVKTGNVTYLKPSSGAPIQVYNPAACVIPTVLVRNGVATPEYRAFITCNAAQSKYQAPIAQTPTTTERSAASRAQVDAQTAAKVAKLAADKAARDVKNAKYKTDMRAAQEAKALASKQVTDALRVAQLTGQPSSVTQALSTLEATFNNPTVAPALVNSVLSGQTIPETIQAAQSSSGSTYNYGSSSTQQAAGPVAAVVAAVQSAVTGKPATSSGGGGGGGGASDSSVAEEALLPPPEVPPFAVQAGMDFKTIAIVGAVGVGAWFAYKTFFKKGR